MAWSVSPRTCNEYCRYIALFEAFCRKVRRRPDSAVSAAHFIYSLVYPHLVGLWPVPCTDRVIGHGVGRDGARIARSALVKYLQGTPAAIAMHRRQWQNWFQGIIRILSRQPHASKAPILRDDLIALVASAEASAKKGHIAGYRDQALALLAWSCALRPGEALRLRVEDLHERSGVWYLAVGRRKHRIEPTSPLIRVQRATSRQLDPIQAVQRWMSEAGITSGPLFRAVRRTSCLGIRAMTYGGMQSMLVRYGLAAAVTPHSFRVGYVTQARMDGQSDHQIMAVTDHAHPRILDRYSAFADIAERGPGPLV